MSSQLAVDPLRLPILLIGLQRREFSHKLGICEMLFAKRLSANGICWVQTAAGPVWKLDLTNSTHRWIVYGKYEGAAFFDWINRNLPPDPIIVDSGANIGQMALYFGTYFPKAHVLAFEPGKYQAGWFSECLVRNPDLPVQLFQQALGDCEQTMYLQLTGHSCSHGGQNTVTEDATGEPIQVVRLAKVLASQNINHVDLWKLDVEGCEIPALNGARELLETKRIRALWVETIGDNGARIMSFMRDIGYQGFAFNHRGDAVDVARYMDDNTLFLPEEPANLFSGNVNMLAKQR